LRTSEIVRVDAKGRIIIPMNFRQIFGLREGMYVQLNADLDEKELQIMPFADPNARLTEFRITLTDKPGALAEAAQALAEANVNLLSTESRTTKKDENAEWIAIGDVSKVNVDLDALKRRLSGLRKIKGVSLRQLE